MVGRENVPHIKVSGDGVRASRGGAGFSNRHQFTCSQLSQFRGAAPKLPHSARGTASLAAPL